MQGTEISLVQTLTVHWLRRAMGAADFATGLNERKVTLVLLPTGQF